MRGDAQSYQLMMKNMWIGSSRMWMRLSRVVRASGFQCQSRTSSGFDPSILRHSGIWGAADEAVLNNVRPLKEKAKNIPFHYYTYNEWVLAARTRPCAARTRLIGLIATPNGRAPAHRSFAASCSTPKTKWNLSNSGRPRHGLFSFHWTTEAMK